MGRKKKPQNNIQKASLPNLDEDLKKSPVIESISQSISTLAQGLTDISEHTQQNIVNLTQEGE